MKNVISSSLHQLVHRYRHTVRESIIEAGLTIPVSYIRTLKCLNNIDNCTAKDISMRLGLDKSQVTRMIKALVEQGYLTKERAPDNHRSQILLLTQCGRVLISEISECEQNTSRLMTEGLTEEQINNFIHVADIMSDNLSKLTAQGNTP